MSSGPSIWNIVPLKPTDPKQQTFAQAYTFGGADRQLPDLNAGFRQVNSDKLLETPPSYLYTVSAERWQQVDRKDPLKYTFLQADEQYNEGKVQILGLPSATRSQRVQTDGFPVAQIPNEEPILYFNHLAPWNINYPFAGPGGGVISDQQPGVSGTFQPPGRNIKAEPSGNVRAPTFNQGQNVGVMPGQIAPAPPRGIFNRNPVANPVRFVVNGGPMNVDVPMVVGADMRPQFDIQAPADNPVRDPIGVHGGQPVGFPIPVHGGQPVPEQIPVPGGHPVRDPLGVQGGQPAGFPIPARGDQPVPEEIQVPGGHLVRDPLGVGAGIHTPVTPIVVKQPIIRDIQGIRVPHVERLIAEVTVVGTGVDTDSPQQFLTTNPNPSKTPVLIIGPTPTAVPSVLNRASATAIHDGLQQGSTVVLPSSNTLLLPVNASAPVIFEAVRTNINVTQAEAVQIATEIKEQAASDPKKVTNEAQVEKIIQSATKRSAEIEQVSPQKRHQQELMVRVERDLLRARKAGNKFSQYEASGVFSREEINEVMTEIIESLAASYGTLAKISSFDTTFTVPSKISTDKSFQPDLIRGLTLKEKQEKISNYLSATANALRERLKGSRSGDKVTPIIGSTTPAPQAVRNREDYDLGRSDAAVVRGPRQAPVNVKPRQDPSAIPTPTFSPIAPSEYLMPSHFTPAPPTPSNPQDVSLPVPANIATASWDKQVQIHSVPPALIQKTAPKKAPTSRTIPSKQAASPASSAIVPTMAAVVNAPAAPTPIQASVVNAPAVPTPTQAAFAAPTPTAAAAPEVSATPEQHAAMLDDFNMASAKGGTIPTRAALLARNRAREAKAAKKAAASAAPAPAVSTPAPVPEPEPQPTHRRQLTPGDEMNAISRAMSQIVSNPNFEVESEAQYARAEQQHEQALQSGGPMEAQQLPAQEDNYGIVQGNEVTQFGFDEQLHDQTMQNSDILEAEPLALGSQGVGLGSGFETGLPATEYGRDEQQFERAVESGAQMEAYGVYTPDVHGTADTQYGVTTGINADEYGYDEQKFERAVDSGGMLEAEAIPLGSQGVGLGSGFETGLPATEYGRDEQQFERAVESGAQMDAYGVEDDPNKQGYGIIYGTNISPEDFAAYQSQAKFANQGSISFDDSSSQSSSTHPFDRSDEQSATYDEYGNFAMDVDPQKATYGNLGSVGGFLSIPL